MSDAPEKLLPCPRCGSSFVELAGISGGTRAQCYACGLDFVAPVTQERALELWQEWPREDRGKAFSEHARSAAELAEVQRARLDAEPTRLERIAGALLASDYVKMPFLSAAELSAMARLLELTLTDVAAFTHEQCQQVLNGTSRMRDRSRGGP